MHRKAIELCGSCVVFLALVGCETPAEDRRQGREKVSREQDEVVRAQREMAQEVRHEKEKQEHNVGEARKQMAEEVTDEYTRQQKNVGEEQRDVQRAREEMTAEDDEDAGKLPRFAAIKNETNLVFAQRAEARLMLLMAEMEVLEEQAKLASGEKQTEMYQELTMAREACAEARKDLDEVRDRTGTFIDDGRLGVAMAINKAQRKLGNVRKDLAATIY